MPHNPELARVWRKAAEQGYSVREMPAAGSYLLRHLGPLKRAPRFMGKRKLELRGTLEELEAWLDRDRRSM